MIAVCHMSSAHKGLDVRIFEKQCVSLARAGYRVHLVIQATDEEVVYANAANVRVHRLSSSGGRAVRMIKGAWKCYAQARRTGADLYHFHDPELIPYGILLSLLGKKVIYDVHEDLPWDILSKEWIAPLARKMISKAAGLFEYVGARWFFTVVGATPFISDRFATIARTVVNVNNYPILGELDSVSIEPLTKLPQVCYVGGISELRGIREIVGALSLVKPDVRLQLGGRFSEPALEEEMKGEPGWVKVDALGWLNRQQVAAVLQRSVAGLVTLRPAINYIDSLPVKMFEYMSAGIPVIASNFPLWREIIEGNDCGVCVDPLDPEAIAEAIDFMITNPERARQMGLNGQRAVIERYNWTIEEQKLLALYSSLLERQH